MSSSPRGDERVVSIHYVKPVTIDRITVVLTIGDRAIITTSMNKNAIIRDMSKTGISPAREANMTTEAKPVAPDVVPPPRRQGVPHRLRVRLKYTANQREKEVPADKDGRKDLLAFYPNLDEAHVVSQDGTLDMIIAVTAPLRSKFGPDERIVCFRADVLEEEIEIGDRLEQALWW